MLCKGTAYHDICSVCIKDIPKGTAYRNIRGTTITVLCTFETDSSKFYKYHGAMHLFA